MTVSAGWVWSMWRALLQTEPPAPRPLPAAPPPAPSLCPPPRLLLHAQARPQMGPFLCIVLFNNCRCTFDFERHDRREPRAARAARQSSTGVVSPMHTTGTLRPGFFCMCTQSRPLACRSRVTTHSLTHKHHSDHTFLSCIIMIDV